ncbi:hypothetical protein MEO94_27005 [Dolichospermum sp. ST_sed9]|nr:hypothetical protein [Dolichospermum sp. ST_sed9]
MKPFVGYQEKPLSVSDLLELIGKLKIENTYYFLRWTHRVSGIIKEKLTDDQFPMLEGQIFNDQCELRWKHKKQNTYEVLFLSINGQNSEFEPLGKDWQIEERNAHFYQKTETRFPKGFDYPEDLNIKQRYFQDKTTATVHFVALTVEK